VWLRERTQARLSEDSSAPLLCSKSCVCAKSFAAETFPRVNRRPSPSFYIATLEWCAPPFTYTSARKQKGRGKRHSNAPVAGLGAYKQSSVLSAPLLYSSLPQRETFLVCTVLHTVTLYARRAFCISLSALQCSCTKKTQKPLFRA